MDGSTQVLLSSMSDEIKVKQRFCSDWWINKARTSYRIWTIGHFTHFLPLPTWGHDFPWAIVTRPVGIFQTPRCHMKDMDIIFSKIPFALLLVESQRVVKV